MIMGGNYAEGGGVCECKCKCKCKCKARSLGGRQSRMIAFDSFFRKRAGGRRGKGKEGRE
jgi:hypothetical protein